MVKIAYCLYGQPRNFLEGYKNIKKFDTNKLIYILNILI